MPVDEFLAKRIFEPLGMRDSFYGEPRPDGPRNTVVYGLDDDGRLKAVEAAQGIAYGRFGKHPVGGSGLTMTLRDYARFSQMLLNGGALDGKRLLGRKTVELMTANHLPEDMPTLFPGFGYGLVSGLTYVIASTVLRVDIQGGAAATTAALHQQCRKDYD